MFISRLNTVFLQGKIEIRKIFIIAFTIMTSFQSSMLRESC